MDATGGLMFGGDCVKNTRASRPVLITLVYMYTRSHNKTKEASDFYIVVFQLRFRSFVSCKVAIHRNSDYYYVCIYLNNFSAVLSQASFLGSIRFMMRVILVSYLNEVLRISTCCIIQKYFALKDSVHTISLSMDYLRY